MTREKAKPTVQIDNDKVKVTRAATDFRHVCHSLANPRLLARPRLGDSHIDRTGGSTRLCL